MRKTKTIAKFDGLEPRRCEDTVESDFSNLQGKRNLAEIVCYNLLPFCIGETLPYDLKKGRAGGFAKTVFYFLRADEKGSCIAIVKGRAVNLGDGDSMHSSLQGDNEIYRYIAATASEKQINKGTFCSVIRGSHCTFQTDDRFVACLLYG